jgi:methylase of polypeptide subunit release factors
MHNPIKGPNAVRNGFYQEVADVVSASVTRGNVLDEGTGRGLLPLKIAEKSAHLKAYGANVSPRAIEAARARGAVLAPHLELKKISSFSDGIRQLQKAGLPQKSGTGRRKEWL